MEIHQVRYFLALCDTLNFTRAAERCNVSQPSLTRAIKALEDEFGGPLFHRERNNTHLTDLGRLTQPYLAQAYASMTRAKAHARGFASMDQAPLAVGIMCTIGPAKLVDFLRDFLERNPGVELHLRDGNAEQLHAWLASGDLDIALYCLPAGFDERYHVKPLFSESYVIAVPPNHRFANLPAVRVRDFDNERYLVRWNCEVWDELREALRAQGVEPLRLYRSERDDWIQAMILAGLGFGFFPECAVTLPGILKKPLIEPEIKRTINLVTVRGRPHTPAEGAFVHAAIRHDWS